MKKFISIFLTICLLSSNLCFKARKISNQPNSISEKTTQQLITKEKDSLPLKILKTSIKATKSVSIHVLLEPALAIVGLDLFFILGVFGLNSISKLLGIETESYDLDEVLGEILGEMINDTWYQETTQPYTMNPIQNISTSVLNRLYPSVTDLLNQNYTIYLPISLLSGGNAQLSAEDVLLVSDNQNNFFSINKNGNQKTTLSINAETDCDIYSISVTHLLKITSLTNLDSISFRSDDLTSLY